MNNGDKTEIDRDQEIVTALRTSAEAQEDAANVLRNVAERLDRLSKEMRKHGAFPIAGQLDRERRRVEGVANGVANGH